MPNTNIENQEMGIINRNATVDEETSFGSREPKDTIRNKQAEMIGRSNLQVPEDKSYSMAKGKKTVDCSAESVQSAKMGHEIQTYQQTGISSNSHERTIYAVKPLKPILKNTSKHSGTVHFEESAEVFSDENECLDPSCVCRTNCEYCKDCNGNSQAAETISDRNSRMFLSPEYRYPHGSERTGKHSVVPYQSSQVSPPLVHTANSINEMNSFSSGSQRQQTNPTHKMFNLQSQEVFDSRNPNGTTDQQNKDSTQDDDVNCSPHKIKTQSITLFPSDIKSADSHQKASPKCLNSEEIEKIYSGGLPWPSEVKSIHRNGFVTDLSHSDHENIEQSASKLDMEHEKSHALSTQAAKIPPGYL